MVQDFFHQQYFRIFPHVSPNSKPTQNFLESPLISMMSKQAAEAKHLQQLEEDLLGCVWGIEHLTHTITPIETPVAPQSHHNKWFFGWIQWPNPTCQFGMLPVKGYGRNFVVSLLTHHLPGQERERSESSGSTSVTWVGKNCSNKFRKIVSFVCEVG